MARSVIPVLVLAAVVWSAVPAAAASEPDAMMPGTTVTLKTGALVKFVAKAATTFDLPDLPDNAPTTVGATLRIFDTKTGAGDNTYDLSAAQWTGLGKPAGSKGF